MGNSHHGFLGNVAASGTQAAAGDNNIRTLPSLLKHGLHPLGIIAHSGVVKHIKAHAVQLA